MRYDADQKDRTRDKLLKEASQAIRRDGPQGISVGSLMASAGLTHGGFYAHFSSKEALVTEALEEAFADAAAMYARATEASRLQRRCGATSPPICRSATGMRGRAAVLCRRLAPMSRGWTRWPGCASARASSA